MNKEIREVTNIRTRMINGLRLKVSKLTLENNQLQKDNTVLSSELTYFKEYSADLEEEVNALKARCRELNNRNMELESEIADMKFVDNTFLQAELAAEAHEAELVSAMGSYLGDDY